MDSTAEVLIVGGGIIGLATAVELALQDVRVTVITRDVHEAATRAAAGMLAPQAEGLPPGPMLELCLRSRSLYPEWIQKLEALTGLDTQYWPCGILAPLYDEDLLEQAPPSGTGMGLEQQWLDQSALAQQQPGLSSEVKGAWWFPKDAQVDNHALAQILHTAAQVLGVNIYEGVTVEAIERKGDRVCHVRTSSGNWQAEVYCLTMGAWFGDLLPIPIKPLKGQMLSVQAISDDLKEQPLHQVLFGTEVYLIPRRNGRILIGATTEDIGFQAHNTPVGIQTLLSAAMRLYPPLQTMPLETFWSGFRPTTPDQQPIIGTSPYKNAFLATGHHRNGILLAPVTASILANLLLFGHRDPLLSTFHWERFQQPDMVACSQNKESAVR